MAVPFAIIPIELVDTSLEVVQTATPCCSIVANCMTFPNQKFLYRCFVRACLLFFTFFYYHKKWLIDFVKKIFRLKSQNSLYEGAFSFLFFLVFIASNKNDFGKCNMSTASMSQRRGSCFVLTLSSQSRQILSSCFIFLFVSFSFPFLPFYKTNLFTS